MIRGQPEVNWKMLVEAHLLLLRTWAREPRHAREVVLPTVITVLLSVVAEALAQPGTRAAVVVGLPKKRGHDTQ
jgi:uncharacterized membrane protein YhhN